MHRLDRALRVLRLRGIGYLWYVIREVVVKNFVFRTLYSSRFYEHRRRVVGLVGCVVVLLALAAGIALNWWVGLGLLVIAAAIIVTVATVKKIRLWRVFFTIPEVGTQSASAETVVLGWIDNDGRLCSDRGDIAGLNNIGGDQAVRRYRFDLRLVADGDHNLIEKDYRGDREAFLRECTSLLALGAVANAPRLHFSDRRSLLIRKSFVPGKTLRDLLVEAGARILTVETDDDPDLADLTSGESIEAVWKRGRQVFDKAVPEGFLQALEYQLDSIHRAGVTGFSLTFGNVVLHEITGEPWFIDFDSARLHKSTETLAFRRDRDRDRMLFNRIYGAEIMTESRVRHILRSLPSGYAPLDLGGGLVTRGFWSVDSGSGRWEYLNGRALEGMIEGRRILDLGSNNGVMPMMMLRAGARAVFGVEQAPALVDASKRLHRVFEWRDLKRYEFDVHTGDLMDVLDAEWGAFDLVTSFCSLYYLEESDMARLAARVRDLAEQFVVQVKTDTRRSASEKKAEKSATRFVDQLLRAAGFCSVRTVVGSSNYPRPILIANR